MEDKKLIQFSDIEPLCLVKTVLRSIWMVVAAALIFAMSASLYIEHFHKPVYTSTMTYAVTSKKTSHYTNVNLTAAQEVAAVFTELLESNVIYERIRTSSDKMADFDGKITASQVGESNFIVVTVQAETPEKAFLAIDAMREAFPVVSDYVSDNAVVQVIRNPYVSATPSNVVNTRKICIMAALIGGVIMIALLCFMSVTRETVQTREGARRLLDAHIIASIPHERKNRTLRSKIKKNNKELSVMSPTVSFEYSEQIQSVCSQLRYEKRTHGRKVFLISSVGENEGKSTIAANIAIALAMKKKNVAIVDADFRNPSQNNFFGKSYKSPMPLNRLLSEPFSMDNLSRCVQLNSRYDLYMLFSVKPDASSTELLTRPAMAEVVNQLRVMDYVIIDSPPMGMFPDAEVLAEICDASVLVVRQDCASACDINDAVDDLRRCRAEFLGCVLNDMSGISRGGYGYGKKYGYGYGYGGGKASGGRDKKSLS